MKNLPKRTNRRLGTLLLVLAATILFTVLNAGDAWGQISTQDITSTNTSNKTSHIIGKDISKNIDGISRNINQIAKRVNATNNAYEEDMVQIKKRQEEVWQLLKSILSQLL